MSDKIAIEVWGSRHVNWVLVDTIGSAGGILLLWDNCHVAVSNSWKGEFSISKVVKDLENNYKWLIASIYGPISSQRRADFLRDLESVRGRMVHGV